MFCRFAALYGDFVSLLRRKSALRRRKTYLFAHFAALLGRLAYLFSDQSCLLRSFAWLQNGKTCMRRHRTVLLCDLLLVPKFHLGTLRPCHRSCASPR